MPIDRFLLLALLWAALAVYPGASEPFKVAGVALVAALLVLPTRPAPAPLARWALFGVCIAACLAAAFALEPAVAIVGSRARAQGVLIVVALSVLAGAASSLDSADRSRLYRHVAMLGGLLASYALLQRAGVDVVAWANQVPGRPAATFSNATSLAGWLVLLLPTTVAVARGAATGRWFWLAMVGLQSAALLASGSRSALLALIAVSAAVLLMQNPRVRRYAAPAALAGLLLLVVLAAWRPASVQDRVYLWRSAASALTSPEPLVDLFGRADVTPAVRPWLGFGPDQQQAPLAAARSDIASREGASGWEADRAHQWLLDRALESGLLGVLSGALLLLAVLRALRSNWTSADAVQRREALCLAIALGAWLLHLQAGFALTGDRTLAWVWIGLALACSRQAPTPAVAGPAASRREICLRITLSLGLLIGALAAGGWLPAALLQRLAPALAAERHFVDGQQRYARALAAQPESAARELVASAHAFEGALALRRFDRDAALAAASAWVEAAANGAGPSALQQSQRWLARLQASGTDEQRLAPLRARIAAVAPAIGE